jgi:hypothetical protein
VGALTGKAAKRSLFGYFSVHLVRSGPSVIINLSVALQCAADSIRAVHPGSKRKLLADRRECKEYKEGNLGWSSLGWINESLRDSFDRLDGGSTCRFDLLFGAEGATGILALDEAGRCHFSHFTGIDLRSRCGRGGH